jgi:hypothetical protein
MEIKEYIQQVIKLAENELASVHKQLKDKGNLIKDMCDNPERAYPPAFGTFGGDIAYLGGQAHELQIKIIQLNHILNNL